MLKEARQQLLLNNFDRDIDDEEFLLLFDINKSDNLDLPYKNYENFDLDLLEDDECVSEFRFLFMSALQNVVSGKREGGVGLRLPYNVPQK